MNQSLRSEVVSSDGSTIDINDNSDMITMDVSSSKVSEGGFVSIHLISRLIISLHFATEEFSILHLKSNDIQESSIYYKRLQELIHDILNLLLYFAAQTFNFWKQLETCVTRPMLMNACLRLLKYGSVKNVSRVGVEASKSNIHSSCTINLTKLQGLCESLLDHM